MSDPRTETGQVRNTEIRTPDTLLTSRVFTEYGVEDEAQTGWAEGSMAHVGTDFAAAMRVQRSRPNSRLRSRRVSVLTYVTPWGTGRCLRCHHRLHRDLCESCACLGEHPEPGGD